ncbi:hypothetical protein [Halomarina oriensis]|uniref:CopG family transcriptional regulator n=1 Tax=Halomarina oriensis TaxID=671145 RepID=A0A6B0GP54_9EURY|nr:hypothetical protein [Halomarina oriensis]MWG36480.1 hypothetical protein [Halomarina oriensis]
MSRTTISVPPALHDRLSAEKPDDESWPAFLESLLDGRDEFTMNSLSEDDVDRIARQTATEVEDRMTRR